MTRRTVKTSTTRNAAYVDLLVDGVQEVMRLLAGAALAIHYVDIETPKGTMKHVCANPSVLKDPIGRNLPLSANELAD